MHINAIGPIITAQKLLDTGIPIRYLVFMSSDSGSAATFRHFEDGYAILAIARHLPDLCCLASQHMQLQKQLSIKHCG